MLKLPVTRATRFVLVRPHYPENVGATARAMKVMGLSQLALVRPSRLAVPEHAMAQKMAVKSDDVLQGAAREESLSAAIAGADWVCATTSRRGFSGILTARAAARQAVEVTARGGTVAIVFGNEKTGLTQEEHSLASSCLRIPMAADQPSVNLAQAAQLVAYELFVAGLDERSADGSALEPAQGSSAPTPLTLP